ncbi:AraC family transcriptional regulator [Paenibacillus sp. PK3_47]|uniref:helix-turn-helix domain-containing protein n=1 Tax=Paenibacillus sp. PK3_47 TaxID=2072642 RepID=UPI00201D8CA2|nr:AraC family transcriptional regulator [Paenibacillus sp. PK3_47]UQZ32690.1 AraC family transcriptional regulator [Paenibacillus sp. PK3_47]
MSLSSIPGMLRFGSGNDPFKVEFDRRNGHFSMNNNHYHIEHELFYLMSGERKYFVKDSVYHIQAGDLVMVNSNALHKTSGWGQPNHERIVLYYSPDFFEGFGPEERQLLLAPFTLDNPHIRLNLQEKMYVDTMIHSLLHELSEQPPGYTLHIRNVAAGLLLYIARSALKRGSQAVHEPSPVQDKMTDIVRHINLHYGEVLQLDTIARKFYISKSHLSRVFKHITGFGFTEYVNITRVREAERLLRDTDWSITMVSEHCGFESLTHFGKVFKTLSGLTPRDYRKLQR